MQCKCGAATKEKKHTKTVDKAEWLKLTYDTCISCGRNANYILWNQGVAISMGDTSIQMFEEMSNDL